MTTNNPTNKREKTLGYLEAAGELLVVIGAALWTFKPDMASIIFSIGAVVFVIGRFMQTPFYAKYPKSDRRELTLRRLYHQRVFGAIALMLSAAMMHVPVGFHYGVYFTSNSWLALFVFFVVTEVYTVFRISAVDKN